MKTLKKVLAVVLALAMVLGMAVTASAGFSDAEKITYKEAVEVMSLAGVLNGYPDGTFKPEGTLTRAEAAKMIVYMLGLEGTSLGYKANFGDITGHWAEEPISVAAGLGIVAGMGNGQFAPNGTLTGFQWAKILLCAMGYDAEIEGMIGAGWEAKVAKLIKAEDMIDGIKKFDGSKAVSRETAAKMAYNVIEADFVGYPDAAVTAVKLGTEIDKTKKSKFGTEDSFANRLDLAKDASKYDAWGRPAVKWFIDEDGDKKLDSKEEYVSVAKDAEATYEKEVKGCAVLEDLGYPTSDEDSKVNFYRVNAEKKDQVVLNAKHDYNETTKKCAADDKVKFGGQGVLTEVYDVTPADANADANDVYRVVEINTYLAKVTKVNAEKTSKNGHVTPATIVLDVYGADAQSVTLEATGYEKNDYVLVQFAGNKVNDDNFVIVGEADTVEGSLSKIYDNKKYTVAGTEYSGNKTWTLGKPSTTSTAKMTWFLDQFGNLIGSAVIDETEYAVITNVYWNVDEKAAFADVLYFDGTTDSVEIGTARQFVDDTDSFEFGAPGMKFGVNEAAWDEEFGYVSYLNDKKNNFYDGIALYITSVDDDDVVTFTSTKTVDGKPVTVTPITGVKFEADMTSFTDGSTKVVVDEDTKFIVRSGKGTSSDPYEYATFTGTQEIPEMLAAGSKAFYIKNDKDVATKIYIKSYKAADEAGTYVFATSDKVSQILVDKTPTNVMDLYLDGKEVKEVKVVGKIEKGKLYKATADAFDDNVLNANELTLVNVENDCDVVPANYVDYLAGTLAYSSSRLTEKDQEGKVRVAYNITAFDEETQLINATDYSTLKEAVESKNADIWVAYDVVSGQKVVDKIYVGGLLDDDFTFTVEGKTLLASGEGTTLTIKPTKATTTVVTGGTQAVAAKTLDANVYGDNQKVTVNATLKAASGLTKAVSQEVTVYWGQLATFDLKVKANSYSLMDVTVKNQWNVPVTLGAADANGVKSAKVPAGIYTATATVTAEGWELADSKKAVQTIIIANADMANPVEFEVVTTEYDVTVKEATGLTATVSGKRTVLNPVTVTLTAADGYRLPDAGEFDTVADCTYTKTDAQHATITVNAGVGDVELTVTPVKTYEVTLTNSTFGDGTLAAVLYVNGIQQDNIATVDAGSKVDVKLTYTRTIGDDYSKKVNVAIDGYNNSYELLGNTFSPTADPIPVTAPIVAELGSNLTITVSNGNF